MRSVPEDRRATEATQTPPGTVRKLLELDNRGREQFGTGPLGQFKKDWSVDRLEERFTKEDSQQDTV